MAAIEKDEFYKKAVELGLYTNIDRLSFYLEKQLFNGIDFQNKRVIDIGGGSGLFGLYAATQGAQNVVVMEPEFDGSSAGMNNNFYSLKQSMGNPDNVELVVDVLENYDAKNQLFDIVLMHNSVNHIDEQGCIQLHESVEAKQNYKQFFSLISDLSSNNAILIICDCTNQNFYNKFGRVNPFMKTIEWDKHQPPEVWADIAKEVGYTKAAVSWTSMNALGSVGKKLFGNRLVSYLTLSHFRLLMQKQT